uniref:NADH-ubiquinone oxidoreductase chain 4L n=1 Tax=Thyasira tokunagai TaxID=3055801 RepID=A0AB39CC92_9BIVA
MMWFFFFFFLLSLLVLLTQKESVLMILLCFELMFLVIFMGLVWSGFMHGSFHSVIVVSAFAVAEAAVGLSLLVSLVHVNGNEGVSLVVEIL